MKLSRLAAAVLCVAVLCSIGTAADCGCKDVCKCTKPCLCAAPATVQVEQTILKPDGTTYTRIVTRPAGYVPMQVSALPVSHPVAFSFRSVATPCANGRCGR
jgi:hypothetical protein